MAAAADEEPLCDGEQRYETDGEEEKQVVETVPDRLHLLH